ncbi:site-specific DNA-methyltransferase [Vibrio metschnikovii]|mgnify:CR=1 FL=1|uniref:Methyltransferase n=11 Tax=Bacteria TaxID=2 RepID=A0A7K0GP18_PARDI|nr:MULTISPECIES: site-specific DNA-methyltransferase [Pseudomonadota]EKO3588454.1 site-specific DNA-methyltransferase [Vibrio metschnikovii]KAB5323003.1 site-specific DNA-methyltransferase [Bacteroides stercoris]MBY7783552.1 site-specific DNA-methyltransferase [Vibrio fluvialis]MRY60703.1 site-specific DNA-methyltransferase [Parabacteroides distasonis]EEO07039.1 hemagglutinin associated protein [Vibrio cholerae TM 11079-80]
MTHPQPEKNNFKEIDVSNLDAITWLRTIESNSVDLVITDPPYESLEKHRKIGTTTRLKNSKSSSNQWFEIFPNERFEELVSEIYRIMKKNSHFYLFCDQETMFVIKPIAESMGFKFWKPIVWDKVSIGMGYHYRARYEFILFFEKGKRKLNNLSIPDILVEKRVWKGYPTEKPVNLAKTLIEQSSNEQDVVIDPFCGSGFVGQASELLNRNFRGNDLNIEAVKLTKTRINSIRQTL